MAQRLFGVDFTCAPSRRKPIQVAQGRREGSQLQLQALLALQDLAGFEAWLAQPGPWFGGFDFPFGLPREFVDDLALGADSAALSAEIHRRCPTRMDFRALVDAWGATRVPGRRLVHRRTDRKGPGGRASTSPLQTRYVPVGFMYYEGLARLLQAGVTLPQLHPGDPGRVAVEAYPGRLASALIGARSYKNDGSADRLEARCAIVDALQRGPSPAWPGLRLGPSWPSLQLSPAQRNELLEDASGDHLDAVLALVQAAWASGAPGCGLPSDVDPVEGWIVSP